MRKYAYIKLSLVTILLTLLLIPLFDVYAVAPVQSVNQVLTVNKGSGGYITIAELDVTDSDTVDTAIVYTLESVPANGTLKKDGVAMIIANTFTQDDINNYKITYVHDNSANLTDSFIFDLTDGTDTIQDTTFNVTIIANASNPSLNLDKEDQAVYRENADPVIVDFGALITDADITTSHKNEIASAVITIENVQDTGKEVLTATTPSHFTKVGGEAGGIYTLTITGYGTMSTYQTIIRSVKYENTDTSPDTDPDRDIEFIISDGLNNSSVQSATVELEGNNYTATIKFINTTTSAGSDFKVRLDDEDLNTHRKIEEEIVLNIENEDESDEETITLEETDDDSGIYEGSIDTSTDSDYDDNNDGKIYVGTGDTITVYYTDELNSSADEKDIEASLKVGATNTTSTSGGGSGGGSTPISTDPFSDVGTSVTEKVYIDNLADDDIVKGFADGTFKPYNTVTRGQMATFIVRAFNLTTTSNKLCFTDVRIDHVHRADIQILCNLNVIKGFSDNTYRPDDPVKREEITKFIVNAMLAKNLQVNLNTYTENFPDIDTSNEFYQYIAYLSTVQFQSTNIIRGYSDGGFHPKDNATRAQMAKMIDLSREYFATVD